MERPLTIRGGIFLAGILALSWSSGVLGQDPGQAEILERLQRLEQNQERLEAELRARDARIGELESELQQSQTVVIPASDADRPRTYREAEEIAWEEPGYFGEFQNRGRGFKLADTPRGELNIYGWTYVRYLNQSGLDGSYTDSFGREFNIDTRNDIQLNKVNLGFNGWVFDPRLKYLH